MKKFLSNAFSEPEVLVDCHGLRGSQVECENLLQQLLPHLKDREVKTRAQTRGFLLMVFEMPGCATRHNCLRLGVSSPDLGGAAHRMPSEHHHVSMIRAVL